MTEGASGETAPHGEEPEERAEADQLIADAAKVEKPVQKDKQQTKTDSLSKRTGQLDELRMDDHQTDLNLKKLLGYGAPTVLAVQVLVVNVVLVSVAQEADWKISDTLAVAWISATVIEVVGVVLVIAKYLFPETGSSWNEERE